MLRKLRAVSKDCFRLSLRKAFCLQGAHDGPAVWGRHRGDVGAEVPGAPFDTFISARLVVVAISCL